MKHLPKVTHERLVRAQRLARGVGELGDWLPVARHQFHHQVERIFWRVVSEVGPDAEGGLSPIVEMLVEVDSAR